MRWLGFLRRLSFVLLSVVAFFMSAGRWDLPLAWMYVCSWAIYTLTSPRCGHGGQLDGVKDWGSVVISQLLFWVSLIMAGLDVGRFHWSDSVPRSMQIGGLVLCLLSLGLIAWSRAVNRFFSSVIRVQRDDGHQPITVGPYKYIRHPGYAGMVAFNLCSALALGSWLAMLPNAARVFLTIRRTALEDRILHEELEGYADYACQVRYRLIPGLW